MSKRIKICLVIYFLFVSISWSQSAEAVHEHDATIHFDESSGSKAIRDPENPSQIVQPGHSPSTNGKLSIDFVPRLAFGKQQVMDGDYYIPVYAQLFLDDTSARGNFIQVSDYRAGAYGWSLLLRQETQFSYGASEAESLKGAVLSFDQTWVNSTNDLSQGPVVSKEVIRLNNIGETYQLAKAENGKGYGTWSVIFGASNQNKNGQMPTLEKKVDQNGEVVMDEGYAKSVYTNQAIHLFVPKTTEIVPAPYHTVLTWVLAELP